MKLYKKICFLICVMLFVFSFTSISYALTPMDQVEFKTFTDGPWEGLRYGAVRYDSNGNVKQETLEWEGTIVIPTSREGSYSQVGAVTNGAYEPTAYFFSDDQVNNVVIFSFGPLSELYVIDEDGNIVADVKDDAFLCNPSGTRSLYGISLSGGAGIAISSYHGFTLSEFSPNYFGGNYYDDVVEALPYMGGLYDSFSYNIKYPGLVLTGVYPYSLRYGFNYYYFPCVASGLGDAYDDLYFMFSDVDCFLEADKTYNILFKYSNMRRHAAIVGDLVFYPEYTGNIIDFELSGIDSSLNAFRLVCNKDSEDKSDVIYFKYLSSTSDDIGTLPPEDSEGGEGGSSSPDYSSALAQIGDILSDVAASVSSSGQQIVNNITYQTTQITNTITNTVTNMTQQITQGLQSVQQGITDKLGSVEEGISGSIEQANEELLQNDQKLHDEKIQADEANTEKVTDAVEKHGNFIIDGLKDLFIPSDDYFKSYFDDLFNYFSERFGFLSFPFDLLSRFVDLIVGTSDMDCVLTLPSFEIMGEQLLYEQSFNLTQFLEENFGFLLVAIRWGINLILLMRFVDLCGDKWNEVMIR